MKQDAENSSTFRYTWRVFNLGLPEPKLDSVIQRKVPVKCVWFNYIVSSIILVLVLSIE